MHSERPKLKEIIYAYRTTETDNDLESEKDTYVIGP